ncbi:MAG: RluA family pseudouridine synthase [Oscillospiraceae bacterium]|nr:RluA family pseudouridine synthase [Oscillospiraceae bacterium]
MRELLLTAEPSEDNMTALDFLRARGFSRRMVTVLKRSGGLTRGGELLRSVDRVREGDLIRVVMEDRGGAVPNGNIRVEAVYEDEDIIIYDKPPFLAVHPSIRHYDDTLANAFAARFPDIPFRPINRLDRDTSGLCVCAKNRLAAAGLAELKKVYFAVVMGNVERGGTVDLPIARESESIIKRCVRSDGKSAVTHYEPIERVNGRTLLKIRLETGRTHQIRVHMSHIGYPLCGDRLYGGDGSIDRQALHCGETELIHPVTREVVRVSAPLPEDIRSLLQLKGALDG